MNILISKGETAPMKMKMKMKMKTRKHNLKKVLLLLPLFLAFIGLHCQEANAAGSITLTGSIDCIAPHGENPNLVCGGEATTTGVTTSSRVTLELSWQVDNPTALVFYQDPVGSQTDNYMTLTIGDGDIEITNADIPDLYDGLVEASFVDGVLVSFTINDGWIGAYLEDSNDQAYPNDWIIDLAGDSTAGDANIQFEFQEQLDVVGDWFQGHINFPGSNETKQYNGDFNGDGNTDILWHNTSNGTVHLWEMDASSIIDSNEVTIIPLEYQIVGVDDFNGDGNADILLRNTTNGAVHLLEMDGFQILPGGSNQIAIAPLSYQVVGLDDFNGDGNADILWRNISGVVHILEMDGNSILPGGSTELGLVPLAYQIAGLADFNGDGNTDILWRTTSGIVHLLEMDGGNVLPGGSNELGLVDLAYQIVGLDDFNGDGNADILWRQSNGTVYLMEMDGNSVLPGGINQIEIVPLEYQVVGLADFNFDGNADILWRNTSNGAIHLLEMDGSQILPGSAEIGIYSLELEIVGLDDFNGDLNADILLQDTSNGAVHLLEMDGSQVLPGGDNEIGIFYS